MPKSPRDVLIAQHLRLVHSIARRYCDYPVDYDELLASGNLGLVLAAGKFDPDRGVAFTTYATYYITREVLVAVVRELCPWHIATAGPWKSNRFFRLRAIMRDHPREEWSRRVGEALRLPEDVAARLLEDFVVVFAVAWDFDRTEGPEAEDPEGVTDTHRTASWLSGALAVLDEREAKVVSWRYLDRRELSLAAIGKMLGVTRERVRQIESEALAKLRAKAEKDGVTWP